MFAGVLLNRQSAQLITMQTTILKQGATCFAVAILLSGTFRAFGEETQAAGGLRVSEDAATGRYTIADGGRPVLTYNFSTVPVPAGVTGKYAIARSDYIHPLYGPGGEVLTKDYSPDHPHHRGLYWAWPEVTLKGETGDLHALQGVFARPVRIVHKEVANGRAVLVAENVWKWGDAEPIVQEVATISASQVEGQRRFIDFEFRFQALTEGVSLARRGQAHYGGFNIRLSARVGQKSLSHADEFGSPSRQAWACLSGIPPEGVKPVSVAILQSPGNPDYPGDWVQYPLLNWLQPTFPSKGTAYRLNVGTPLVLRYRLVVFYGEAEEVTLQSLWTDYAGAGCVEKDRHTRSGRSPALQNAQ